MRRDQRRQFLETASQAAIAASAESRAEITALMAGERLAGSDWRERRAWVAELFLLLDRLELVDAMMAREPEAARFEVTRAGAAEAEAGFKQLADELLEQLSRY